MSKKNIKKNNTMRRRRRDIHMPAKKKNQTKENVLMTVLKLEKINRKYQVQRLAYLATFTRMNSIMKSAGLITAYSAQNRRAIKF